MEKKATEILSSLLMVILILAIAADAALLVTSPFWLDSLYKTGTVGLGRLDDMFSLLTPTGTQFFMQIFVALSGIALGGILVEAVRLLLSVRKGSPFSMGNARALLRAAWLCLIQMALFIAKMLNGPTVLTLGCVGIFLIGALLFFVLAGVFREAALLREDRDLTI